MVKMCLSDSDTQANSCLTVCQNLSAALDGVKSSLNDIEKYDNKGAAADSAKSFASSVVVPYIDQAKNLLNTIQSDVKDFPAKYRSKVDSKDWSTEKLEKLINECETQAIKQSAEMGMASAALSMANSPDTSKILGKMQSNIDATNKKKKKYQKILRKLNEFDASSPSIFSDIKDLNKALSQGSVAVSGNYSNGSYHKPKDLSWEKVGKGGDKDVYKVTKAKKADKKSVKDIIVGLIPSPKSKVKEKIKAKFPKKWRDWNYKKFERTFFKEVADGEKEVGKINKFGKFMNKIDKFTEKVSEKIGFMKKGWKYFNIGIDLKKRIDRGEPVIEAAGRTVVSLAATKVADLAGGVAGRVGGGAIGMTIGGIVGSVVPGAGTVAGAEIGAEIGSTIGGIVGSDMASSAASKELNKDIK